ncbi:hypothetical protein GCM10010433_67510 [Streptomyces pulveraceus]
MGGVEVEVRRFAGPVVSFPLPLPRAVGPPPVIVAFPPDVPLPPEGPAEEEDVIEDAGEAGESFESVAESSFPRQAVGERPTRGSGRQRWSSERALFLPPRSVPGARASERY